MVHILIGTPAYNSIVHTDYLHSIMSYTTIKKLNITVMTLGNESLITRARNKIFSYFADNLDKFDYLLFLDSDIMFYATELMKLLNWEKDIIGAPVRLKNLNRIVLNYGKILDDSQTPLIEVDKIGSAVMLISNKLAIEVKNYAIENKLFYENNINYTIGDYVNIKYIYDVFKVGIYDNEYKSEDYYFCKLAKDLGHKIYVDISCNTGHNGTLKLVYN